MRNLVLVSALMLSVAAGAADRKEKIHSLMEAQGLVRMFESQMAAEEACAKTLYNLSMSSAPFDPESPYWIIPNALAFVRHVGVADSQVIKVVAA